MFKIGPMVTQNRLKLKFAEYFQQISSLEMEEEVNQIINHDAQAAFFEYFR